MWRLAHAHGALLGAINILFALTLRAESPSAFPETARISTALIAATVLLPFGFFLGGVVFYSGDPGVGVLLVPVGATLLLLSLYWIASALRTAPVRRSSESEGGRL
jgi:heme A synthase